MIYITERSSLNEIKYYVEHVLLSLCFLLQSASVLKPLTYKAIPTQSIRNFTSMTRDMEI